MRRWKSAGLGIERLQARGFDAEHIHRSDRTGYKAGALENGTRFAKGEFLLILDADFVPNPDLLQKTIHYFTDDKIGMIQTRWGHLNRTFNVLTRIQAMFLDGHLELEQTARNRSGRFFTFNGTGGIWRKSCIADAGGWEHDTLTEDMDLSYRAQLNGWRFIFLNDVETPAELPVDMDGFKSQQHRWTKGSIQVCKKVLPAIWRSNVPLFIKMEATAHLTSNFAYLLLICLCFLIYPNQQCQPDFGKFTYYIINVPIFFFSSVSVIVFYLVSQKALRPGSWWKEIPYLPLLLALGIGMSISNAKAVLEALCNHQIRLRPHPEIRHRPEPAPGLEKEQLQGDENAHPVRGAAVRLLFPVRRRRCRHARQVGRRPFCCCPSRSGFSILPSLRSPACCPPARP